MENNNQVRKLKFRIINIAEAFLGVIFITTYFVTKTNLADVAYIAFFSGLFLGVLYFPLGFYTLKSPEYNLVYAIIFGALFSLSLVGIILSLMKIDLFIVVLMLMVVLFIMVAGIQAIVYYFLDNKKDVNILFYARWLTIRYVLFFALMVYAMVTYDFRF